MVLTRPTIKIEKGAAQVEGFVAPTPAEHGDLLMRAEIVQNHEVVLLMLTRWISPSTTCWTPILSQRIISSVVLSI
jgi:hypothetical protein